MLPYYFLPPTSIRMYYQYVHSKLRIFAPHLVEKAMFCVFGYYVCRIVAVLVYAGLSYTRVARRQKKAYKRFKEYEDQVDVKSSSIASIRSLTFAGLCDKLQKQALQPADVLTACVENTKAADHYINAVTDVIDRSARANSLNDLSPLISIVLGRSLSLPTQAILSTPLNLWYNYNRRRSMTAEDVNVATSKPPIENLPKGLLYGVPVSFTEVIEIKMDDATAGLSCRIGDLATENAVVVKLLQAQGAVPFIRTNVPQTCYLGFSSSNPIYGVTKNPVKLERSPGGTSSGEAALIAARGSFLGVGTDIAGGIRIPAHFCGVCGLKPTSDRVSKKGVFQCVSGQNAVPLSVGPLSVDVAGLVAFMKSVCVPQQSRLDPRVPLAAFNEEVFQSKRALKIGIFVDDGYTKCTPAVRRAMFEARTLLQNSGHVIVEFTPPDMQHMLTRLFLPALQGDQSSVIIKYLAIDRVDPSIRPTFIAALFPYMFWWLLSWIYEWSCPIDAAVMAVSYPQNVSEWWKLIEDINTWRQEFMSLWRQSQLDAILCPVMPCAAVQLGRESRFKACLTYPALFNLLDFPAGTIPITRVSFNDIDNVKHSKMYKVDTLLEKIIRTDQAGAKEELNVSALGLPVGVQVAALPHQEELVLRILRELEDKRGVFNLPSPCWQP